MATMNLSVEDSSALIQYDPAGAWTNPSDDPLSQSYSGDSFHSTSVKGATATIKFNGTGLNIFAGTRPEYGAFQLLVDGNVVTQGESSSSSSAFNALIASSTGLTNGPHVAVFEHTDQSPIDIDRIELLTEMGLPGSTLSTKEYDDNDTSFIYGPSDSDWIVNNADIFGNNSLHFSNNTEASASLTWDGGDGFSIWTTAAPDHDDFEVYLDGEQVYTCSGGSETVSVLRTKILMYYSNSLGPGQHTLRLQATGQGGPFVDLDSVMVYSTTGGSDATAVANGNRFPPSVIAGIATGGLAFLLLIVGVILFVLRRRRRISNGPAQSGATGLDIEIGKKQEGSMKENPSSSTSSFFALPREPLSGIREDDSSSIHSRTLMIPEKSTSGLGGELGPPIQTMNGAGYYNTNRPARQHQSIQPEVVYPDGTVNGPSM